MSGVWPHEVPFEGTSAPECSETEFVLYLEECKQKVRWHIDKVERRGDYAAKVELLIWLREYDLLCERQRNPFPAHVIGEFEAEDDIPF